MGLVYLGTSPGGRKVAIKVVHPHYASDPKFRSRFAREVAAARQVGGFHTAAVMGADPDAESPWMATAYIPGPSLDQAIARRGPLDEAGVRKLGAALAEGLAAIHDCGLIHRDLKPSNVILADDGPRIIDFGIAKGTDTTALTSSQVIIGTLRYMSPEQLRARKLTPASDIFALGTVLAHAATGHDPFDEQDIAVVSQILNDPPNLNPLTGHLRDIISACLAKDPSERPSTADLLARLNHPRAASEPARDATPEPVPEQITPPTLTAAPPGAIRPQSPAAPEPSPGVTADATMNAMPPPPGPGTPLPATKSRHAPAAASAAPARNPQRWRSPPRTALAAAGTVAAVGLATLGVLLSHNHPATPRSATGPLPATSRPVTGPLAATSRPVTRPLAATSWSATGSLAATFNTTSTAISSVAFGPSGTLATGANNGITYLWNTTTGKITATLTETTTWAFVNSVAFGPGDTLAVGDSTGSAYLWNTTTRAITATLTDPTTRYVSVLVAFGPGGTLATTDSNGDTYLWNTATHKITATLTDPASGGVSSVAFGPDGTLATADSNSDTYLWNTTTGKVTATLTDPASRDVSSVAFGPGGTLATGDYNGRAYLWKITYRKS